MRMEKDTGFQRFYGGLYVGMLTFSFFRKTIVFFKSSFFKWSFLKKIVVSLTIVNIIVDKIFF